jgi:hypothetical protein
MVRINRFLSAGILLDLTDRSMQGFHHRFKRTASFAQGSTFRANRGIIGAAIA